MIIVFNTIIFPPVLHYSEAPWCHAVDTPVGDALFVKKYVMIVVTVIITLCLCHIILAFYRNYYFVLYKEYQKYLVVADGDGKAAIVGPHLDQDLLERFRDLSK